MGLWRVLLRVFLSAWGGTSFCFQIRKKISKLKMYTSRRWFLAICQPIQRDLVLLKVPTVFLVDENEIQVIADRETLVYVSESRSELKS